MQSRTQASLEDVYRSAMSVRSVLKGVSLDQYLANIEKQAAIERFFIVIGEALVRIRDREPVVFEAISDAPDIIRFRNLLVHGYDGVHAPTVYELAHQSLDQLISDVEKLLS